MLGGAIGHERPRIGMAKHDKTPRVECGVLEEHVGYCRGTHGREIPVTLKPLAPDRDIVSMPIDGNESRDIRKFRGQGL